MPRKVYIISKGGFDYSGAEQYGKLVFLTDTLVDKLNVNKLYMLFKEKLEDSNESDYLIITVLPIMSAVASGILAKKHGRVNYLLYSYGKYVERNVIYDV